MSTCCWCTPGGASTADFLQRYATRAQAGELQPAGEFQTADEDLCYCLECVIEYHRARDELPFLHEVSRVGWGILLELGDPQENAFELLWEHSGN